MAPKFPPPDLGGISSLVSALQFQPPPRVDLSNLITVLENRKNRQMEEARLLDPKYAVAGGMRAREEQKGRTLGDIDAFAESLLKNPHLTDEQRARALQDFQLGKLDEQRARVGALEADTRARTAGARIAETEAVEKEATLPGRLAAKEAESAAVPDALKRGAAKEEVTIDLLKKQAEALQREGGVAERKLTLEENTTRARLFLEGMKLEREDMRFREELSRTVPEAQRLEVQAALTGARERVDLTKADLNSAADNLAAARRNIAALREEGLMGVPAQASKLPRLLKELEDAQRAYEDARAEYQIALEDMGKLHATVKEILGLPTPAKPAEAPTKKSPGIGEVESILPPRKSGSKMSTGEREGR